MRLSLGRDRVGETVGAVVADVIFDGYAFDIVDEAAADQDRVVLRNAQLRSDPFSGQPGRNLLDGGVYDDVVLFLEQFVERVGEVVVAADRKFGVEIGDEDHERIFGVPPYAFQLQAELCYTLSMPKNRRTFSSGCSIDICSS